MSGLGEWLMHYIQQLRPELRPDRNDERLHHAARQAIDNGWHPKPMAAAVSRQDYTRRTNAVLGALERLEQLAETKPGLPARKIRQGHPNGCVVCDETMICEDPAIHIPFDWTTERLALLNILAGGTAEFLRFTEHIPRETMRQAAIRVRDYPGMADVIDALDLDDEGKDEDQRGHAMEYLTRRQQETAHGRLPRG